MNYISEKKYNSLKSGKVKIGDVLFCLRGSLGKNAVIDFENDAAIASSLVIIRPNQSLIKSEYISIYFNSLLFKNKLMKLNNGSSQPNLSAASIKSIEISVPDMKKQNEIINKLLVTKELIDKQMEELELLNELVRARFVEMFGDPVINDKKWPTVSVENLCDEIYGGGTPSKAHEEYYENGDIPWVSSKDMKTDVVTDSQIKINQLGIENSTARLVPVNSVIMVIRSGILKHTLPVAINAVPITVNQDLKVFVPGNKITSRFLAAQFKMQEKSILFGVRAVTADNIEFNSLKARRMIVPPLELQNQFASFVEEVDKSRLHEQLAVEYVKLLAKDL